MIPPWFITHFLFSPEGKKFRSKRELKRFLRETDLYLNADDFDFSVNGRALRLAGKVTPFC
jgi:hypothetical protein